MQPFYAHGLFFQAQNYPCKDEGKGKARTIGSGVLSCQGRSRTRTFQRLQGCTLLLHASSQLENLIVYSLCFNSPRGRRCCRVARLVTRNLVDFNENGKVHLRLSTLVLSSTGSFEVECSPCCSSTVPSTSGFAIYSRAAVKQGAGFRVNHHAAAQHINTAARILHR